MKNALVLILLIAFMATAVFAACKVGELGWSYSINRDKPNTFKAAVKGAVQNNGKATVTATVKIDVLKKSDNTKVASMSAIVDNIAPGAKASFTAGPAMVIPSGTKVPDTYTYKLVSCTER